jgi:hypothetical protein
MKITAEFIVLHDDGPMPEEDKFCPSFWQSKKFDSDGDYYYENIDGRWTNLEMTKLESNDKNSMLVVNTYREKNRNYEPATYEIADLKRYVDYKLEGRYLSDAVINGIRNLSVTSLFFETYNLEDYQEFLKTVHFFLGYSKGVLVNFNHLDASSFYTEFLGVV